MRNAIRVAAASFVLSALLPAAAHAQASITGVARDTSGGVLPGVTVEASSPALIERVRSVVTDGTGQYRFVDLRPGTYTVTFTLPGFSTLVRDGIELEGTFVATVNADLGVGGVEETITVTGETPIVDVQSSQAVRTIDQDVIAALPSSRGYQSFTVLQPGLNVQGADVGGQSGALFSVFQAHGGRRNEGQVQVNGLSAGWQGMGVSGYVPEVGSAQEVTFQVTGGLGEAATGGPQMNLVPREGGNTFGGSVFGSWSGESWQSSNLGQEDIDAGLAAQAEIDKLWDLNATIGGPISRDKLWFFYTVRSVGSRNKVAGIFINKNRGDINSWTYDPDLSQQAIDDNTTTNSSLRLTWQASPRNKVAVWWDEQKTCQSCTGGGFSGGASGALANGALAQEADGSNHNPIRMGQVTWVSPVTSRLLLEAKYGLGPNAWFGDKERDDEFYSADLIQVTENAPAANRPPGLSYRGQDGGRHFGYMNTFSGSVSYITGAHSFKAGAQYQTAEAAFTNHYNNRRMHYTFNGGAPASLTMFANDSASNTFEMYTTALYAQDQWTVNRLTLQGGIRFERITSYYPAATYGPDVFRPEALNFPELKDAGVGPKDINPRFGAAYDLFGDGRTAFKFSLGRYPTSENSYGTYGWQQQPANRVSSQTTRQWTDTNGNFEPDCVLLNMSPNGECGAGNPNFGQAVVNSTYDPNVLKGWNVREYSWDLSVGVQQEIMPRVSVEVTYVRRSWDNQTVTDNRAVSAADFDRFGFTVPVNSALPGGGGYRVDGFYDIKPQFLGLTDNFVTRANNFGDGIAETYNGVDINLNARLQGGLVVQGGFNVGNSALDNCSVARELPESLTAFGVFWTPEDFCDISSGWNTTVGALASYTIPTIDVLVSGTVQSRPWAGANFPSIANQSLIANHLTVVPLAELGRPLASGFGFLNIVEPGTVYGDRINQVDFRVSKILRFGGTRTNVGVDVFNVFNTNAVSQYNQTYNPFAPQFYLVPNSLVSARFVKISAQFDW